MPLVDRDRLIRRQHHWTSPPSELARGDQGEHPGAIARIGDQTINANVEGRRLPPGKTGPIGFFVGYVRESGGSANPELVSRLVSASGSGGRPLPGGPRWSGGPDLFSRMSGFAGTSAMP